MPRVPDPHLPSRLVAAAVAEFARAGYARASVDGIARAAGLTKGAVYSRFSTKEELFFAALDGVRAELREAIRAPRTAESTGAGELTAVLGAWLGFHLLRPEAARLLAMTRAEVAGRPTAELRADAREDLRALRARLRQALVRGAGDGTLDVRDPVLTAFLLTAGLQGVLAQWLAAPVDVEALGSPATLADALVEPLRTGAAPGDRGAGVGFIPPLPG
ncbi:MAG: TetR/AcrR family transcriptional regulator [Planctomycetota bacterium]